MACLELFLLGPPHVKRDGQPVKMGRRKAIALAAYLAVTGESHTRDALATLFWPESNQSQARMALRKALSVLRRSLGEEWLEVEQDSLALKRDDGFWLDVDRFRRLLVACQTHSHPADQVCSAGLVSLAEAVTLYRDDFLAGFTLSNSPGFDDWQRFQNEKLRSELDGALERLVGGYGAHREFGQAVTYAKRWLALNPLNELAHRYLMKMYALSGQRDAARRQYHECVQVLETELGLRPERETIELHQAILEGRTPEPTWRASASPFTCPTNLPLQPTRFVGRKDELAQIDQLLKDPACRLLTVVGAGGIGKTRLALESVLQIATEMNQTFTHGICLVPFAPLNSADFIVPTIADALQFSFHGRADPKEQLFDYLREKEMLLLLDNFEHLLGEDGAGLLAEMLSNVPGVKLLVTSRERLDLRWEWPFEIRGLTYPQNGESDDWEDYSAVQLFLQSARRAHPSFGLSAEEKPFAVRICQLLEGVPLAIELAAAWVEIFSCREIVEEIERDLGMLATSLQDVPERQRSLMAAFDYSWNLLSDEERSVFRKLSVFRGGFRREAAQRVAGASLSLLSALMHKSLLRRNATGWYEVLEVLRQYTEEKLRQVPQEWDRTHNRHCEYYAEFLHQREEHLKGEKQQDALKEIGKEIDNVRSGWQWAVAHRDEKAISKFLESLCVFYERQSWFQEAEDVLGKTVERLGGADSVDEQKEKKGAILGRVLAQQGWFCYRLSRFEMAKELLQASLSILHHFGAQRIEFPLKAMGSVAYRLGEYMEAKQLFQESLAICKEIDDRHGIATNLNNLGLVAMALEKYVEAKLLIQESLSIHKENNNRWGMAICLTNLGIIDGTMKEYRVSKHLFQESLVVLKEIGDQQGIAMNLTNLGVIAEKLGNYDESKQFHQESLAIFKEIGEQLGITHSLNNLGFALCALGEFREARKCFQKALEIAIGMQANPETALLGIATLLMKEGEKVQAVELITYALCHPATYGVVKDRAEQLFSELESQIPPHIFAAAQKRGKARDLEYYVRVYGTGG